MSQKFFVDSNIIIETFKKNSSLPEATEIFRVILDDLFGLYYINEVVFDETYYHLILKGKLSSQKTEEVLFSFIQGLYLAYVDDEVIRVARNIILKYKLKTHDALILSTLKRYKIPYLISLDSDFVKVAKEENIKVISKPDELKSLTRGS